MKNFDKEIKRRGTNCIKWDMAGNDVLPFWIADSDYPTCDKIVSELEKRVKSSAFGYTYPSDDYYEAIVNWMQKRHDVEIEKEWIIPSMGVVTALYLSVFLFTKENDEVIVSTPVYNPFYSVIENNNRKLICNKLIETNDTYVIDFSDLEEKMKSAKMYILCNPHNPVGRCFTHDELDKVVDLCKKYNVILVSDEIHNDIIMKDAKFYSVMHYFSLYENIIVCTAPSKTFNIAGLEDSNIIIKNEIFREKFSNKQHDLSISTPNILALTACEAAYKYGEEWVDNQNEYLTKNRDFVYSYLKENIPLAKTYKLEGTYLMWINMRFLNLSQEELIEGLKEKGILVNSGEMYSCDYIGYIRLNIACPKSQLEKGLKIIKEFVLEKIK